MLSIDPNHINAAYARGACENKRGNFAKAIEDYNKAIEISPHNANIYIARAVVFANKEEYTNAWGDVQKADLLGATLDPKFVTEIKSGARRERKEALYSVILGGIGGVIFGLMFAWMWNRKQIQYKREIKEKGGNILRSKTIDLFNLQYINIHLKLLVGIVSLFIILLALSLMTKIKMIDTIQFSSVFCGILYIVSLIKVYKDWYNKVAFELAVDKEKKEFIAYFSDHKKEIKFTVNDIKEVWVHPAEERFRFYLKNGTWVTWVSSGTDMEQDLKDYLKSLEVPIIFEFFK